MSSKTIDIKSKEPECDETIVADGLPLIMRRGFWLLLFVGVIVGVYAQLIRDEVLPIQEIKVSGEFKNLMSQDLKPILTDGISGNFFTVNVGDIYQQLIALPWVEKVWIHRVWPNTIKIDFKEQKPIAILNGPKGKGLLNKNGEVFSQDVAPFSKFLPQFFVADNYTLEAIDQFRINDKILRDGGLESHEYYYDERKSQAILLSNGVKLILGRMNIEERLMRFVKAYQSRLKDESRAILKVDLRYTNGFAIDWLKVSVKPQSLIKMKIA